MEGSRGQEPLSVAEAVGTVAGSVKALPRMVVEGEVSGSRPPKGPRGHLYFDLKDESARMSVTIWSGRDRLNFTLRDGMRIRIVGRFQVYEPWGRLNFIADSATPAGEGVLRAQVAALARKLQTEGLMDDSRKRPIPRFCERVAVVTSLSGEVIDDVKRTLARRNPLVAIDVVGCSVQGAQAPATITRALAIAASYRPDAILLVRGGGSFEDLMCFNDELVARAIAACSVPVITGIGHEPDTSIADMVADRRCSTPTAAAESVAPAIDELEKVMNQRAGRLNRAFVSELSSWSQSLSWLAQTMTKSMESQLARRVDTVRSLASHRVLQDPYATIRDQSDALNETERRLMEAMPAYIVRQNESLGVLGRSLGIAGGHLLQGRQEIVAGLGNRLHRSASHFLASFDAALARDAASLEALSPLRVLARGYALARDDHGHVILDASELETGEQVEVNVAHGVFTARVEDAHADF